MKLWSSPFRASASLRTGRWVEAFGTVGQVCEAGPATAHSKGPADEQDHRRGPGCRKVRQASLGASRSMQVKREVHTLRSSSSVMVMSQVARVRPRCTGVATPVTWPCVAER